jgi:hypothetical protein
VLAARVLAARVLGTAAVLTTQFYSGQSGPNRIPLSTTDTAKSVKDTSSA